MHIGERNDYTHRPRVAAEIAGAMKYTNHVHEKCGTDLWYTSNGGCVFCSQFRRRTKPRVSKSRPERMRRISLKRIRNAEAW